MSIRPIIEYPNPLLKEVSKQVESIDDSVKQLVEDLTDTMFAARGYGISAIQIGVPLRVFVLDRTVQAKEGVEIKENRFPLVFINPELVSLSKEKAKKENLEGCLSFPGVFVPLERSAIVTVKAQDLSGSWFECECDGVEAQAIQHELDHLDGTLFIDKMSYLKRETVLKKMKKRNR